MPGPPKKADKKALPKKKANGASADVTINDFANSPSGVHGRLKKAIVRRDVVEIETEGEEMKKNPRSRRKQKLDDKTQDDSGIDYPLDLWFLISEYIRPEAVGKFALICKSSYHVVKTAKFWFHLYKRYYKPVTNLPPRLAPQCMVRPFGLRACAIRSLHFTYFSSFDRVENNPFLEQEEPHSLVKRRCCLMWHTKGESRWYFYFKLKETTKRKSSLNQMENWENDCNSEMFEMMEDVSINSEEGCRILRVACSKYGLVPLVNGLILQTVKIDLSPRLDHHRLQLSFGTSFFPKSPTQIVVLNGVVDYKVLDWWHPCYPHQDTASTVLQPCTESWDSPNFFDSIQDFPSLQPG